MRPHRPAPAWASAPIRVEMPEELGDPNAPAPSDPTAKPADPDHNILRMRGGRLVFRARRPAALVVPLAAVTETAGILFVLNGATIGWFVIAAPVVALLFTGVLLRPTLELTREGLVHRQYPFSQMNPWENIDGFAITRAGNRLILGYRLVEGARKPRRQPAAALLRAAQQPFDGGYFADSIAAPPEVLLATVDAYLHDPARRAALPAARR
jgi:hypothetical protein